MWRASVFKENLNEHEDYKMESALVMKVKKVLGEYLLTEKSDVSGAGAAESQASSRPGR